MEIYLLLSVYTQLYIWMSSGHVLIMWKLSCIINDDHIFLLFGMYVPGQSSCHLYIASGHIKWSYMVKLIKESGHGFYLATPSCTNESVWEGPQLLLAKVKNASGRIGIFESKVHLWTLWEQMDLLHTKKMHPHKLLLKDGLLDILTLTSKCKDIEHKSLALGWYLRKAESSSCYVDAIYQPQ